VRLRTLTWRRGFLLGIVLLGVVVLALWLTPSGQYLLLPDKAQLVEPLVTVANEEDGANPDGGGIYMVDILVRKANLLERIFPGINDGADLVPENRINPEGVSEEQRRQSNRLEMTRSQQIAAAIALQHLGYEVDIQTSGAEISLVMPGSPAADVGLRPGDVIVEAEDRQVESPADLRAALSDVEPRQVVTISVRRSGGVKEYRVGTRPAEDEPTRAVIGVIVQQAATFDLPIEVTIEAGAIGGPSAGLAFALDIVDELGREVDQGRLIVATGELTLEGDVEPVGGIEQKVIGAHQAGADIFVVPVGNAREAERYAPDGLAIVPVATFAEALRDLDWRSGGPPPIEAAGQAAGG
jgi:PDZ domain-containing protein